MPFDLSQKIVNRAGQEVVYPKYGRNVQHDVLSLITEALWEAGGNDLKTAVKMGVCADRLQQSEDRATVELSDDDMSLVRQALQIVKYPPYLAVSISAAIPKLIEG
jgi:hypothetical protein